MDRGMDGQPYPGHSSAPGPRGFSSTAPVESQRERLWGGSAPLRCPQPDCEAKRVERVPLQTRLQRVAGLVAGAGEGARAASFRTRENKSPPARICEKKKKQQQQPMSAVERIADLKAGRNAHRGALGDSLNLWPDVGSSFGPLNGPRSSSCQARRGDGLYPRKPGAPSSRSSAAAMGPRCPVPSRPFTSRLVLQEDAPRGCRCHPRCPLRDFGLSLLCFCFFFPSTSRCAGIPAAGQFSLPILFFFLFTKLQVALFASVCSWLATSDLC